MPFEFPEPVAPGDCVAVVAPASGFDRDRFWSGLAWVRDRYRVRCAGDVFARTGYLAGDDARRARELRTAMLDPEVKAILAARGGYGAMRVMGELPWGEFARHPKWIVGFSDVTALHAILTSRGIASIHGPHVTGLGAASPWDRAAWLGALERRAPRTWTSLRVLHAGTARGPIVGGNLALLAAMAAAGQLALPPGAVLAIEDIGEPPYRVDRMLTSLVIGGHLARVAGIVCGDFTDCAPRASGVEVLDEVVADRTKALGVPVFAGAPFGHGARNEAFILGATAEMREDEVTLRG